ncbi:hypothetical protein SLA2020_517200 [Shorea laevis]
MNDKSPFSFQSPSSFPSPDAGRSVRCRQLEIRGGRSGVEGLGELRGGAKRRRVEVGGRGGEKEEEDEADEAAEAMEDQLEAEVR